MADVIISSVITGIVTLAACLVNNHYQNMRVEKSHDATIQLVTYRLEQLEKKQDLHNNAVSRLYEVERKLGIDEEKIRVANHRIDDLENEQK